MGSGFAPWYWRLRFRLSFKAFHRQQFSLLFWVYAALTGISLSSIFLMYTGDSIAYSLLLRLCLGKASLYGYTTKRDLSPMADFCLWG